MNWNYDERGNAVDLSITLQEIKQRKWHTTRADRIPLIWRETVRRVLAQEAEAQDRAELAARISPGGLPAASGGWFRRLRAEQQPSPSGAAGLSERDP
jgi:hypothetical protein